MLLAPIDRGRGAAPGGLAAAADRRRSPAPCSARSIGNFVFRRLPGSPVEWIACLAAVRRPAARSAPSPRPCSPPVAACGRSWRRRSASRCSPGRSPTCCSASITSPATMARGARDAAAAGRRRHVALAAVGVGARAGAGLARPARGRPHRARGGAAAGGADRRAALLGLGPGPAHGGAAAPPARLRAAAAATLDPPRAAAFSRHPVWRRGWQSFLRWPLGRIVRVLAIAVAAGAATAAAWSGVTLLFVLPGALLMVAALDLVEPLAQESDHPTRRELLPVAADALIRRHLAPSAVAMATVLLVARRGGAGLRRSGDHRSRVGAVMLSRPRWCWPAAPPSAPPTIPTRYILTPQLGYAHSAAPVVIAIVAVGGPVLVGTGSGAARWLGALGAALASSIVAARRSRLVIGLVARQADGRTRARWRRDRRDRRAAAPRRCDAHGLGRTYDGFIALGSFSLELRRRASSSPWSVRTAPARRPSSPWPPGCWSRPRARSRSAAPGRLDRRRGGRSPTCPTRRSSTKTSASASTSATSPRCTASRSRRPRSTELIERLGLGEWEDSLPSEFSHGMRQKASIALALVRPFAVLLADEPFDGLDPPSRDVLFELLAEARAGGAAVVVSTHRPDVIAAASRCVGDPRRPARLRRPARGRGAGRVLRGLGVIPKHVVHPDLLGGWRCRSPSNKEEPDEAPR